MRKEASLFQTAVSGSFSISSNRFVRRGNKAAARTAGINREGEINSPVILGSSYGDVEPRRDTHQNRSVC